MSRVMNLLLIIVAVIVLGVAIFALYVRLAPNDPDVVHADPLSEGLTGENAAYLGPPEATVFDTTPDALFAEVERVILSTPRVAKVAEGPEPRHASYIARTALWGFPDYVSVRVVEAEGGARYAIWSRSRFGSSDLGANAARLADWRGRIAAGLGGP